MGDMGLVVVGAAGRMGRMLVKAISETEGCVLAGAVEKPGSIALGEDAGLLDRTREGAAFHLGDGLDEHAAHASGRADDDQAHLRHAKAPRCATGISAGL